MDRVDLTEPRKSLAAGGSQLDGTTEGDLKGFVTGDYGNPHLVRVGILIVSGIGSNLYSVNATSNKDTLVFFYIENPRL